MILIEELRIGNRVFWKPNFSTATVLIQVEITSVLTGKAGYIRSHLEHRAEPFEDDLVTTETPFATSEELDPIPISSTFTHKVTSKLEYPGWIKYVHELQNWYFWTHEKKELEISD